MKMSSSANAINHGSLKLWFRSGNRVWSSLIYLHYHSTSVHPECRVSAVSWLNPVCHYSLWPTCVCAKVCLKLYAGERRKNCGVLHAVEAHVQRKYLLKCIGVRLNYASVPMCRNSIAAMAPGTKRWSGGCGSVLMVVCASAIDALWICILCAPFAHCAQQHSAPPLSEH